LSSFKFMDSEFLTVFLEGKVNRTVHHGKFLDRISKVETNGIDIIPNATLSKCQEISELHQTI